MTIANLWKVESSFSFLSGDGHKKKGSLFECRVHFATCVCLVWLIARRFSTNFTPCQNVSTSHIKVDTWVVHVSFSLCGVRGCYWSLWDLTQHLCYFTAVLRWCQMWRCAPPENNHSGRCLFWCWQVRRPLSETGWGWCSHLTKLCDVVGTNILLQIWTRFLNPLESFSDQTVQTR